MLREGIFNDSRGVGLLIEQLLLDCILYYILQDEAVFSFITWSMVKFAELLFVFAHDGWWIKHLLEYQCVTLEEHLYDFLQTLLQKHELLVI